MPGYIMHLAEAGLILKKLEQKRGCPFSPAWRNQYELGALLPDTKTVGDKRYTHFWKPEDIERFARAPHLPLFLEKYGESLAEPVVLGYLAHLHLDASYVNNYWPGIMALENEAGESADSYEGTTRIRLLSSGEVMERKQFFSNEWYYGDYTIMNRYLMHRYQVQVPQFPPIEPFQTHISEVNEEGLTELLQQLEGHLKNAPERINKPVLRVLDVDTAEKFLEASAGEFVQKYGRLFLDSSIL